MAADVATDGRGQFWRFAAAGIFFQGGVASVEANTIVSALVHGLTGSPLAVGAAAAITRWGWLFPQIIVAYLAQSRERRMPFYAVGAYGRALCLALVAVVLWLGAGLPGSLVVAMFFVQWISYGFVSGVVGVPYNDIVARAVPSSRRSRLLAVRFFGGGFWGSWSLGPRTKSCSALSFIPGTPPSFCSAPSGSQFPLHYSLPIWLTPMTATCRVPPLSRVKLGIGWSRGVARDAEQ